MLLNRKFKFLAVAAVLGLTSGCFQSREQKEEPNPFVGQSPKTGGSTGAGGSGSQGNPDPFTNKSNGSVGSNQGSTQTQQEDGRGYVNGWNGMDDELPAGSKWLVASVAIVNVDSHGVILGQVNPSPAPLPTAAPLAQNTFNGGAQPGGVPNATQPGGIQPGGLPNTNPTLGAQPGANPQVQETAEAVIFTIPAGTGQNAWNTPQTEVVAKVGKKFIIVNQDSITHQWHTNGSPCPHGNPIRAGGQAECTPNQPYSGPPLYDHITRGQFYIKAVQQ